MTDRTMRLAFALACGLLAGLVTAQGPTPPPGYAVVDDMILPEDIVYGDSAFTANPWPFGVVAYTFNANVTFANQLQARKAMDEISAVCGVIFVPRTNHPDWVVFNATTYNSSLVGRIGGPQTIDITSWGSKYIIAHEIMHALGYLHEQSRPDRDNFVTINWGNISSNGCPGSNCGGNGSSNCMCNFQIVNGATTATPYDFLSIMHYGRGAFSTSGADTITCNAGFGAFQSQIGNRTFMSLGDVQGLQQRYGSTLFSPNLNSISPSVVTTATGTFTLHVYGSNFFEGSPNASGVQGTKIVWNGTQLATSYVDSTHVTATITPAMIAQPQVIQVSVTNPAPAWGPLFATLPLTINCQSGSLAIPQGGTTTTTNGCQNFSITPAYNTANVVAVGSSSDWDLQMGTASALAGGSSCDFVVGSGFGGAGTIAPSTGNVSLYSGAAVATLQHATSTEVLNGQPTIASMSAGTLVRAFHFSAAAVSTRTIHVAGPVHLRWKLLFIGNAFSWRSSTGTSVVASGLVGSAPVSGIGIVPAPYCLVVYSDYGPTTTNADLTITMCFDFTPAPLASSNFLTTINQGPYSCVPFTIAPLSGRWNVVGVSSPSDWDIQIGPAVSQSGGSACDYVLANGHFGGVFPSTGVCSPYSFPGASASLQFAPTATLPSGAGSGYSYTYMLLAFEVEITAPGTYDFFVNAPGYSWDLHPPGVNQAWRRKIDRLAGGFAANGSVVTFAGLSPGWHCIVVYHDGGATGLVSPSASFGPSSQQQPVLSAMTPSTVTAGGPAVGLSASGSGFSSASVVRWNGSDLPTTFVNSTTLGATVAASLLTAPGNAVVTVNTPGVGSSAGQSVAVVPAVPALNVLSPSSVPSGWTTFTLELQGSGFNAASRVLWNGAAIPTNFVAANQLTAIVDATLVTTVGSAAVSVDNPGAGTSGTLAFAIANGTPGYPIAYGEGLEPIRVWSATALGLPTPLGGLQFAPGGASLVVGCAANFATGALYSVPVTRDPVTQRVLGLGPPQLLVPAPQVDGGVASRNGTWFYARFPANVIGQFNGTTTLDAPLPVTTQSPGGLAFVPPGMPNAGTLLVSSYTTGSIYSVATSPVAGGFLTMGAATLYASLPVGLEGIAFIPSGAFAGDLLVAQYDLARVSILDIDPTSGLPVGGAANPALRTIVPTLWGVEGVAVDPLSGELWLSQFGDQLVQAAGLDTLASLVTATPSPSVNAGATIEFRLRGGTLHADRPYLLAGSFSGTSPGLALGAVVAPLNPDALTQFILANPGPPLFSGFVGTLDANGVGVATLTIPPGLGLVGPLPSDWAWVTVAPIDFASDPCHVVLMP